MMESFFSVLLITLMSIIHQQQQQPEVIGAGLPLFERLKLLRLKEQQEKARQEQSVH